VRIFKPWISLPTWLGRRPPDRRTPVYNFVNRNRPPKHAPYSVRVERCRDWMGGQWTYDGHVGTDFALPVGTPLTTTAAGKVVRVASELDHGGLKVCIDHGRGLFTTSGHMSRVFVQEGELLGRGQVIGLSGASGIEFVLFFPWVSPHLHLNVWLGGEVVDPYAREEEVGLWRVRNDPRPVEPSPPPAAFEPSAWDPDGVAASIDACRDPGVRDAAHACRTLERRAAEILFWRNLTPAAFREFPPLYLESGEPTPCLDLPLRPEDYAGAALPGSSPSLR
jgi:murein DD-endopeptidase MepM/ murein hydrolase activator NlpD